MSVDVGALDDFAEGTLRIVGVNGREVGIVRWKGDLHAIHNLCTHQSGPVCGGILSGRLTATRPGDMELDAATPILACPWHGWEFDVRSGRALHDGQHRLRKFPVRIAGGRVLVDIDAATRTQP
jgi:nitrite reductase/ring-hydroxylating ferredoxin subunit